MIVLFLGLFFSALHADAVEPDQLFLAGNAQYQAHQYDEALSFYKQLLDSGYISGELYFNTGNCYYKLEQYAQAILYYERAGRLLPKDRDVTANLEIAKALITDQIETQEAFFLVKLYDEYLSAFSLRQWLNLFIAVYLTGSALLIGFILLRGKTAGKILLRAAIISGVLALCLFLTVLGKRYEARGRSEAIIMSERVDVLSAPGSADATRLFTLHAGAKVRVYQQDREWAEIVLSDGKSGWVLMDVFAVI